MIKAKEWQQYMIVLVVECFSTCILILIGEAGIANYKFTRQSSHSTLPIGITFGVGVYSAIMVGGPMTGAHLNPAFSIALVTIGKLKVIPCFFYVVGQILGAFLGAALVYLVYLSQFNLFDGGIRQMTGPNGTADILFTVPAEGVPHWNTLIDQIVGTAFMMIFALALGYEHNGLISEASKPFAFALMIVGIISAFSINAGAAINPARDFGPRLFGAFVYGWNEVFRAQNYYFWVPVVGPIVGAILGAWLYQGFIWLVKRYGHWSHSIHRDFDNGNEAKDVEIVRM